jgi:hypothetical protein
MARIWQASSFFVLVNVSSTTPVQSCFDTEPEIDMGHDWMIRTIEDLEDYALRNGFPALAAHLEQARYLAWTESANIAPVDPSLEPAR